MVADEFLDICGRSWPGFDVEDLCPTCFQPDETGGKCNHEPLSKEEAVRLCELSDWHQGEGCCMCSTDEDYNDSDQS